MFTEPSVGAIQLSQLLMETESLYRLIKQCSAVFVRTTQRESINTKHQTDRSNACRTQVWTAATRSSMTLAEKTRIHTPRSEAEEHRGADNRESLRWLGSGLQPSLRAAGDETDHRQKLVKNSASVTAVLRTSASSSSD